MDAPITLETVRDVVETHWGFRSFRPLQDQAMQAVLDERDSLVVLPTGGGKSLCYQAPALARGGVTVVVSPLIALMKDQVDGLRSLGIAARQFDSSLSAGERADVERALFEGTLRLLFVSPERLVNTGFIGALRQADLRAFAIDEAHCISHWGHDFRPEYRQMGRLKELFPETAIHAYTATATESVRKDICNQLKLRDPEVLVGSFDRPNLTYRILPRTDRARQTLEIAERHRGEAGIVYCLRRTDVDDMSALLRKQGFSALPYHAGMDAAERSRVSEDFAEEKCDIVVATVAFGMGIDRSNIRYVLHADLPKSIEHYQQETGRAGRDGLEAECVLLYSAADVLAWQRLMERSVREAGADDKFLASAFKHLEDLDRFCRGAICRHRALVEYFDQTYATENCGACDLCLGDVEEVPDATTIAMKVLSCVARVQERFGIGHVMGILRGENTDRIRKFQHENLTTYGLLRDHSQAEVRDWIYQLLGQKLLQQEGDEYPVLKLNPASWEVMKKQRTVRLVQNVRRKKGEKAKASKSEQISWEGVDRPLFEELRRWRRELAQAREMPAYIILTDASLRELAAVRPSTLDKMRTVVGIGKQKLDDFGADLLGVIVRWCSDQGLAMDQAPPNRAPVPPPKLVQKGMREQAFQLFRQGGSIDEAMKATGRTRSTVADYLCDFLRLESPKDPLPWVDPGDAQRIGKAAEELGSGRLAPLREHFNGEFDYDQIRIALAWLGK